MLINATISHFNQTFFDMEIQVLFCAFINIQHEWDIIYTNVVFLFSHCLYTVYVLCTALWSETIIAEMCSIKKFYLLTHFVYSVCLKLQDKESQIR